MLTAVLIHMYISISKYEHTISSAVLYQNAIHGDYIHNTLRLQVVSCDCGTVVHIIIIHVAISYIIYRKPHAADAQDQEACD